MLKYFISASNYARYLLLFVDLFEIWTKFFLVHLGNEKFLDAIIYGVKRRFMIQVYSVSDAQRAANAIVIE